MFWNSDRSGFFFGVFLWPICNGQVAHFIQQSWIYCAFLASNYPLIIFKLPILESVSTQKCQAFCVNFTQFTRTTWTWMWLIQSPAFCVVFGHFLKKKIQLNDAFNDYWIIKTNIFIADVNLIPKIFKNIDKTNVFFSFFTETNAYKNTLRANKWISARICLWVSHWCV